jgi:hypothetical protein
MGNSLKMEQIYVHLAVLEIFPVQVLQRAVYAFRVNFLIQRQRLPAIIVMQENSQMVPALPHALIVYLDMLLDRVLQAAMRVMWANILMEKLQNAQLAATTSARNLQSLRVLTNVCAFVVEGRSVIRACRIPQTSSADNALLRNFPLKKRRPLALNVLAGHSLMLMAHRHAYLVHQVPSPLLQVRAVHFAT